ERESDLAPHRFITPPPQVEQAPEKPAAGAPEAARSFAPVPLEREPGVPQHFSAPVPVDTPSQNPAIPPAEARRSIAPPASGREPAPPPKRFIAPAPVDCQPEPARQPISQPPVPLPLD